MLMQYHVFEYILLYSELMNLSNSIIPFAFASEQVFLIFP